MSIESYAKALAAFQAELPHIAKGQTATVPTKAGGKYTYDFADLADITAQALPLLAKHGLSFSARPTLTEAGFVLRYRLMHADGFSEEGDYPLPDPMRSSPQELGSAITYARRYSLVSVTGIAPGGEDDDGQKAQESRASQSSRPAPARQSAPPPVVDEKQDEINRAKRRVKTLGDKLGMDMAALGAEFNSFTDGADLRSAGLLQLQSFADDLERQASAGTST